MEIKVCATCKYREVGEKDYPCCDCSAFDAFEERDYCTQIEDVVNHPSHYETGKFECIDVMTEAIGLENVKGFCVCNAFKYIYRCTKKHETPVEDVKKAVWYLNKFLELEGALDD